MLQVIGLVVPLSGLAYGLQHRGNSAMFAELFALLIGGALFLTGKSLVERAGSG
jgi:low temperature requirement protein LtrA